MKHRLRHFETHASFQYTSFPASQHSITPSSSTLAGYVVCDAIGTITA
jgi:hypothetical protein